MRLPVLLCSIIVVLVRSRLIEEEECEDVYSCNEFYLAKLAGPMKVTHNYIRLDRRVTVTPDPMCDEYCMDTGGSDYFCCAAKPISGDKRAKKLFKQVNDCDLGGPCEEAKHVKKWFKPVNDCDLGEDCGHAPLKKSLKDCPDGVNCFGR